MFIKAPVIAYTFDRTQGTYVGDLAGWDSPLWLSSDFYGNALFMGYATAGMHGKVGGSPWTGGAMTISFTARFDALNPWSRVFDFGDGPNTNNILFANAGNTNTASFRIIRNGVTYALEIPNAITVGSDQMWVITVDENGVATVYRTLTGLNTSAIQVELVRQQMVVPEVDQRSEMYIGRSNWSSDGAFQGEIDNFFVFDYAMSQEQAGQYFSQMSQSYTTSTNVWDALQSNYHEHGFDVIDPSRHWVSGDAIVGGSGVSEQLVGSDQPDHVFPNGGTDTVYAFGGDDVITISADWGSSVVTVHGGTGTDTVYYISREATADDRLLVDLANQGSNQFLAAGDVFYDVENVIGLLRSRNDLRGDGGANFLVGGSQQDLLMGRGGNDVLWGLNHNDTLYGGAGDDQLDGGHYDDYLFGEDDRDILKGGSGNDELYGDAHADELYGEEGADSLFGGAGDDILDGGNDTSIDTLYGGSGNDTYHMRVNDVTVDSLYPASEMDGELGGIDTVITYALSAYTLQDSFENLTLGAGSISGDGNGQNNRILGNAGDNTLSGHGGDDEITGGGGRDTIYGGAGNDTILLASSDTASGESIDGGADHDRILTSGTTLSLSGMSISNVEQIGTVSSVGTAFTVDQLATAMIVSGGTGLDSLYFSAGTFTQAQVEQLFAQGIDSVSDASGARARNSAPVITSNGGGIVASPNPLQVRENTTYIALVTASDADPGAVLSYSIVGSDSRFQIDSGGVLSFVWAPDYENPAGDSGTNQYGVAVRVTDEKGASDEQTFFITVTDQYLFIGTGVGDVLAGENGNDQVYGNDGNDTLSGLDGNDFIDGGAGDDAMHGGAGNDTYVVDSAGDTVHEAAGAGNDDIVRASVTYTLGANVETLYLTGSAALNGTGNNLSNTLYGNSANNVLIGLAGAVRMSGGAGDDTYYVDNVGDRAVETSATGGIDTVWSSVDFTLAYQYLEKLFLTGVALNATGNSLNNTLVGTAAANLLDGMGGNDVMNGGAGNDTYVVDSSADTVIETAGGGTDTVLSSATFALSRSYEIENLTLTGFAAVNGYGNHLANRIEGNDNNNILNGSTGADTMIGKGGTDTYFVDNVGDRVIETSATGGVDTVHSSVSFSLAGQFIENLGLTGTAAINATGNSLANRLYGNDADNVLDGGGGADFMTGRKGNDTYIVDNAGDRVLENNPGDGTADKILASVSYSLGGIYVETLELTGSGNIDATGNSLANTLIGNGAVNRLIAHAGNDTLSGGGGDDQLFGGGGNDRLTGGAGKDRFYFDTALSASTNVDAILDFSVVDDAINLSRSVFTAIAATGTLAASAFRLGTAAADADDRIVYDSATGRIYYDADGSGAGAQVLFATVAAGTALTNLDFYAYVPPA